jgi:hypothetical protein
MVEKEPENWRELLAQITSDSATLQRVIQDLGVREITTKRWISGESEPRHQNLRRLLNAFPEYRERFLKFFTETFEDFTDIPLEELHQEISPAFYTQVFQLRSTINRTQRYWTLTNMIITQALAQLDPENLGMAITVTRCMISEGRKKILSLRQSVGQGTLYWPGNLEQHAMFLGAESLAGYALENCRPQEVLSYKDDPSAPLGHQLEHEESAIAHPILYAGRIAGCLLFSSTEPNFFLSPARQSLVADYTNLIALAFEPEDFVETERIELRIMPPQSEQKKYFESFRKRLANARTKLYEQKLDMDAELYVWAELEKEILNL